MEAEFVAQKVRDLLDRASKVQGLLGMPVEPSNLAGLCGVLTVEHRQMIPEGVLSVVEGGFRIYLQGNFVDQPGTRIRQRFTLAHELVHTFYYDLSEPVPRLVKGAPRGQKLERICHSGAAQILVPESLLLRESKLRGPVSSAEDLLKLAHAFDVSPEVLMRRLHTVQSASNENFAAVLVVTGDDGIDRIQAACHRPWLLCHAKPPKLGMDFASWVHPLIRSARGTPPESWETTTSVGELSARRVIRSSRSFILNLCLAPPRSSSMTSVVPGVTT